MSPLLSGLEVIEILPLTCPCLFHSPYMIFGTSSIFVFYYCCNILLQLGCLQQHTVFFSQFLQGQKSEIGLTGWKPRCQQESVPYCRLWGRIQSKLIHMAVQFQSIKL